jgi:hypothetical protein
VVGEALRRRDGCTGASAGGVLYVARGIVVSGLEMAEKEREGREREEEEGESGPYMFFCVCK